MRDCTFHAVFCLMQQEAVTLLESAEGEGDGDDAVLLEGEQEAGIGEEAEAEQAARALLGVPGISAGMPDSICACSAIPAITQKLASLLVLVSFPLLNPFCVVAMLACNCEPFRDSQAHVHTHTASAKR